MCSLGVDEFDDPVSVSAGRAAMALAQRTSVLLRQVAHTMGRTGHSNLRPHRARARDLCTQAVAALHAISECSSQLALNAPALEAAMTEAWEDHAGKLRLQNAAGSPLCAFLENHPSDIASMIFGCGRLDVLSLAAVSGTCAALH